MFILKKSPDRDFIVLNLTDTQLSDAEWAEGHQNRLILERTIHELVERVKPDLITITGDLAWAGHDHAYDMLGNLLDSFGITWAPVWGNHDNQNGSACIDAVAARYMQRKYCIYEKGDSAIGSGNYVIAIEEEGKIVEGLIMIDSHDRASYIAADGSEKSAWAKLIPPQVDWYKAQVEALRSLGCEDTAIFMHIPFYAYRFAYKAAYADSSEEARKALTVKDAVPGALCWNLGYEQSSGVMYEGIGSYEADDGVFEAVKAAGTTTHVIVGHEHVNNFMIPYEGVKLIYALKTGAGCYWDPRLNGGTVIRISGEGIKSVVHEYVDVSDLV